MSHPQMPLMTKHIGDSSAWQKEKKGGNPFSPCTCYLVCIETKNMARNIASVVMFLFLPLITQGAGGSSCEADLGHDQSDQRDLIGGSDGGGEWKESLKEMESKFDQAVAGVNREVGRAIFNFCHIGCLNVR